MTISLLIHCSDFFQVGWVLLALSVALVNAGSGLTALYILLCCVGWTIMLLFPGRYALRMLAIHTGSIENGPTMSFMTCTILCGVLLLGTYKASCSQNVQYLEVPSSQTRSAYMPYLVRLFVCLITSHPVLTG